jgi:hypothetical protein
MSYQDQLTCMSALMETFDSIGYTGVGQQGLARCMAAFEAGDKERAIHEYRQTIGDAPNFASAITDLDTESFSPELAGKYGFQLIGVMTSMFFLMDGAPE